MNDCKDINICAHAAHCDTEDKSSNIAPSHASKLKHIKDYENYVLQGVQS